MHGCDGGRKAFDDGRTQRFAYVSAVVVGVVLFVFFSTDFIKADNGVVIELAGKINPNDAFVASLMRLPGIGKGRAESIVAYRQEVRGDSLEVRAFESCEDIARVKGVGPVTVGNICEYLKFD